MKFWKRERRCFVCGCKESTLPPHQALVRVGPWWKLWRPLFCGPCKWNRAARRMFVVGASIS